MLLSSKEKEDGYELQGHGIKFRVLTKHGKVIEKVENQMQLAFAIEGHERYLDILDRNRQVVEEQGFADKTYFAMFIVLVIVVASLAVVYSP